MDALLNILEAVARLLEVLGSCIILFAVIYALIKGAFEYCSDQGECYTHLRRRMGRGILLGLEILVAADIIATVLTDLNLSSVLALAVIVIIRTILSLSIEVEIDGKWPWAGNKK